ncbi:hypothetical protein ABENE_07610 [Asticcacaulis benevestitus DSM 16100 = ATCC BAA-896]|uniref:Uncharacterized protein n=1 Tax=Asticcacaulis benevestitus DSM 16100 = ATCC BAA-896 TaxID=1121022 RepID=V4RN56_9CAUL|nr:hypothetical protein ABENE_07610 [Asticcacaulis benevestitus DSM 16100 = ATCC BAA-896]
MGANLPSRSKKQHDKFSYINTRLIGMLLVLT